MDNKNKSRVVILPDYLLTDSGDLPIIKLKHPRTGSPMLCVLGKDDCLFEIVDFKTKFSSWFIGDKVVEDGGFHMVTPIDPTFFILMYLNKNGKYCPFEDCLVDSEYQDTKHLLACCTEHDLEQVANVKDIGDFKVYAYDKTKTLQWLRRKVEQSVQMMKDNDICTSDDSRAVDYNPVPNEKEDEKSNIHQTCCLLSEYLPEEITIELFKMFELEFEENGPENTSEEFSKEKKMKCDESDISINGCAKEMLSMPEQDKKKTKMTLSQKRLMKVDKSGMKSISSFFQKK